MGCVTWLKQPIAELVAKRVGRGLTESPPDCRRLHVGQRTLELMANIKRLTGLLPICSYCKRIRSDHDYWEQVESYITEHTEVRFSHGICPPCLVKAMAEIDEPAVPTPNSGT